MSLISPDEMLAAGILEMLGGQLPATSEDWAVLMNFFAVNVNGDIAEPACLLMKRLYDIPLSDDQIINIVRFQQAKLN